MRKGLLVITLLLIGLASITFAQIESTQSQPNSPADGIPDLKFHEFFINPVGPKGLEPTDRLRSLNGKFVRIQGYMVRQEVPQNGRFLLAPFTILLHDREEGLSDYLPPATLFVTVTSMADKQIPYDPRPLILVGILSLGNQTEPDGRISIVRLTVDSDQIPNLKTVSLPNRSN